ncbi:HDIG domain-containing protein [Anaerobranca californiensis DSM 14826]|uniref:HDIG domain-containing protein n=1 Tax=Anaerobranca californiensis DSM 14826 TaxID=1120989 RepID=A0A1M6QNL7_9FIRM|nr:HDIG domain-containing metalloprotein [Anaerobranca californiensis]SHK21851.1 HDIG domain-containing protein [Anaerobranca californiensis DSM 14826]
MQGRIKQFIKAITAKVTVEDEKFLNKYLKEERLKGLFRQLPTFEQRHSLDVAYTILEKYSFNLDDNEKKLLIQGALLHDIGKLKIGLNPITKSMAVVMDKLFPQIAKKLTFIKFIDGYYNHPKKGGQILKKYKLSSELIYLVENHHNDKANHGHLGKLIKILMECDDLN